MVPVQPLHPVAAPVAPRRRVGRTPFRLGVHLLHPDEAVIHSFADGGSGTGARFSAQEIASTLTRRRSSAVLPWSGPPRLLSQFLSHSPPSGTVHQCSPGSCLCSSRTVADASERWPALLESVLGATPREFESPILRHADLQEHPMMTAGMRASRVELVSFSGLNFERRAPGTPDSPQLFCQVTGVANGPEQRATRRRSVRPTVRGWRGPS